MIKSSIGMTNAWTDDLDNQSQGLNCDEVTQATNQDDCLWQCMWMINQLKNDAAQTNNPVQLTMLYKQSKPIQQVGSEIL